MKWEDFIDQCLVDENGENLYHRIIGHKPYSLRLQYFLVLPKDDKEEVPVSRTPPFTVYRIKDGMSDDDRKNEFIFYSAIRHLCFLCSTNLHYLHNEIYERPLFCISLPDFSTKVMLCANLTGYLDILGKHKELKPKATKQNKSFFHKLWKSICPSKQPDNIADILAGTKRYYSDARDFIVENINFTQLRDLHAHHYQLWWWHRASTPRLKGFFKKDLKKMFSGNASSQVKYINELFEDIKKKEKHIETKSTSGEFISGREILEKWYDHLMNQFKEILKSLDQSLPSSEDFAAFFEEGNTPLKG